MNAPKAEPMVALADLCEAFDVLCPVCQKAVRDSLLKRLSRKREACDGALPRLAQIRRETAAALRIDERMLSDRSSTWYRVKARRIFARQARKEGFSLSEIGDAIGRHHTSVHNLLVSDGWAQKAHR